MFDTKTPRESHSLVESGAIMLDVRSESEFAEGHPTGSLNVPVFFMTDTGRALNEDFVEHVEKVISDKTQAVVVSCAGGRRSIKACELLANAGYSCLTNCDGGYKGRANPETGEMLVPGWKAEGLPVTE